MSRRTATLMLSGALVVVLAFVALMFPVPYVALTPGPSFNTLGSVDGKQVIEVHGRKTYPTPGHLNMVTVDETVPSYHIDLLGALEDWWSNDALIVPRDTVYPPGQSNTQSNAEDLAQFESSQDAATVAALTQLGIKPSKTLTVVESVDESAPAAHKLQPGDVINTIDGTTISSPDQAVKIVGGLKPGADVVFGITRGSTSKTISIVAATSSGSGAKHAYVGFSPGVKHQFPVTVSFQLANVGGPSAGLMFTLGIIQKLTPYDLTGGHFVAGTGTMADNGSVGPIGGIQMKTITARRAGASYFFTPSDNCSAAEQHTPKGLTLIKVNTLKDALNALQVIRTGHGTLPTCR